MGPSERDPAIRRTRSGRLREQVFIGCFGKGAHGPASNSAERTLQKTALRKSASSPLLLNISSYTTLSHQGEKSRRICIRIGKGCNHGPRKTCSCAHEMRVGGSAERSADADDAAMRSVR